MTFPPSPDPLAYETRAQIFGAQADYVESELRAVPASEDTARQWECVAAMRQAQAETLATAALIRGGEYPVAQLARWGLRLQLLMPLRELRPCFTTDGTGWRPPRVLIVRPVGQRRPGWHRRAARMLGCVVWEDGHALTVPQRRTARGLELRLDWRRGQACPRHRPDRAQ